MINSHTKKLNWRWCWSLHQSWWSLIGWLVNWFQAKWSQYTCTSTRNGMKVAILVPLSLSIQNLLTSFGSLQRTQAAIDHHWKLLRNYCTELWQPWKKNGFSFPFMDFSFILHDIWWAWVAFVATKGKNIVLPKERTSSLAWIHFFYSIMNDTHGIKLTESCVRYVSQ